MTSSFSIAIIIAMALVAYLTRAAGLIIMSRVHITKRVEAFLTALSGSVLIALIVPVTLQGDWGTKIAVASAILFVAFTKQTSLAMIVGIVAAVLLRNAFIAF